MKNWIWEMEFRNADDKRIVGLFSSPAAFEKQAVGSDVRIVRKKIESPFWRWYVLQSQKDGAEVTAHLSKRTLNNSSCFLAHF